MKTFRLLLILVGVSFPLAGRAQIMIAAPTGTGWQPIENQFGSSSYPAALLQTFVAPDATHTQLDRFEFLAGAAGSAPADFTTYVAQWNPTTHRLVGAPLWTSSLQSAAGLPDLYSDGSPTGGRNFVFETGGLCLDAGQTYALLILAPPQSPGETKRLTGLPLTIGSSYEGGEFNWVVNFYGPLSYEAVNSASIYPISSYDIAFGAAFSEPGSLAVPESATSAAVLGLALAAGLFVLRRRSLGATAESATSIDCAPRPGSLS